ncbi:MAG: sigma-70 family RNA polymerase sigma factor [bacterium]
MPPDPTADRALVQRAQHGEQAAFDSLVLRHAGSLRNIVIHHGVRGEEVDDVLQEVFLRAWRGLAKFKGDASFTTWLYRIAFTVTVDRERRRRRRPQVAEPLDPRDEDRAGGGFRDERRTPEEHSLGLEQVRLVRAALKDVDPLFRQILILREMENLSYQEIADSLGIAEGTVKSRLARARGQLKGILETKYGW